MANKLKIFLDADVIFAGAAAPSEQSASHVILRMGVLTILDCVTSEQAVTEVERNLQEKLPFKLPEFRLLVSRCLRVISDPQPATLSNYENMADASDMPLLVAAIQEGCSFLITFNIRHYHPDHEEIKALKPGDFIITLRQLLTQMSG